MRNNTLYLHVGLPKAGSTALQWFLLNNQASLAQHGISYSLPKPYWFAHYYMTDALNTPALLPNTQIPFLNFNTHQSYNILSEQCRPFVDEMKDGGKNVILSSEAFFSVMLKRPEIFEMVTRIFCGVTIKVIVYLRRQDLWANSAVAQLFEDSNFQLLISGLDSGKQFFEQLTQEAIKTLCADRYDEFLTKAVEGFGRENVIVRAYERDLFYCKDIGKDFALNILGLGEPVVAEMRTPADSISNLSLNQISYAFCHYMLKTKGIPKHVLTHYTRMLNAEVNQSFAGETKKFVPLSPQYLNQIYDSFYENNLCIKRQWFDSAGIPFFSMEKNDEGKDWQMYTPTPAIIEAYLPRLSVGLRYPLGQILHTVEELRPLHLNDIL